MSKLEFDARAFLEKRGLLPGGHVQEYIDSTVLNKCKPKLPFETGALTRSGDLLTVVGSGEVIYHTPYAARWYYNVAFVDSLGRHCSPAEFQGAPERGSHWFERMKNEGGTEEIGKGAAALAGGRYKP